MSVNKPSLNESINLSNLTPEQAKAVVDALSVPGKLEAEEHERRKIEQAKGDGGATIVLIGMMVG